jgi:hypothetical protein
MTEQRSANGHAEFISASLHVFLKARRKNFPVAVLGTSLTNSTSLGYL